MKVELTTEQEKIKRESIDELKAIGQKIEANIPGWDGMTLVHTFLMAKTIFLTMARCKDREDKADLLASSEWATQIMVAVHDEVVRDLTKIREERLAKE